MRVAAGGIARKVIEHKIKNNFKIIGGLAQIGISKINYDFLYKFSQYILIESQCTNNGMMKHMQRLKKVTNLCIKNQYITYDPYNGFHIN